jgi:hypothetical protein
MYQVMVIKHQHNKPILGSLKKTIEVVNGEKNLIELLSIDMDLLQQKESMLIMATFKAWFLAQTIMKLQTQSHCQLRPDMSSQFRDLKVSD